MASVTVPVLLTNAFLVPLAVMLSALATVLRLEAPEAISPPVAFRVSVFAVIAPALVIVPAVDVMVVVSADRFAR